MRLFNTKKRKIETPSSDFTQEELLLFAQLRRAYHYGRLCELQRAKHTISQARAELGERKDRITTKIGKLDSYLKELDSDLKRVKDGELNVYDHIHQSRFEEIAKEVGFEVWEK